MARVLLGISGSIAAYKSPLIVRLLRQAGFLVTPIVSRSALKFVTPLTLSTVSEEVVLTQENFFSGDIPHLQLEREADVLVVAPATANMIAKFALGLADDVLSTVFLSFTGPKLVVPAMHVQMWQNPIVQERVASLKRRGVLFLGPESGELACGDVGMGRMVAPDLILLGVQALLLPRLDLTGQRFLISLGGTREPLDSMRVLTNRSTGKLGSMLAILAAFFGAEVQVVGTVSVVYPGIVYRYVETVAEMGLALEAAMPWCSSLYMAAAVADFTVERTSHKLKRTDGLLLDLKATPDLVSSLAAQKGGRIIVGFCLEDQDLLEVARGKLVRKNLDYIIANTSEMVGADRRSFYVLAAGSEEAIAVEDVSLLEAAYQILVTTSVAVS
ncbi:MAG: bifunctional phosphopantothenoylcysteine decarboxylase/phosphopantothenate--cysteine ligase CoaBC [Candidatus Margulisbacteria bacterium]|nr:bifunctional phosphopantothenoylcysteine decarboxylase/phosphopantothenate--cysteine ligase CoaBC [Candidatus Margulisiibacteriota bacterium]